MVFLAVSLILNTSYANHLISQYVQASVSLKCIIVETRPLEGNSPQPAATLLRVFGLVRREWFRLTEEALH